MRAVLSTFCTMERVVVRYVVCCKTGFFRQCFGTHAKLHSTVALAANTGSSCYSCSRVFVTNSKLIVPYAKLFYVSAQRLYWRSLSLEPWPTNSRYAFSELLLLVCLHACICLFARAAVCGIRIAIYPPLQCWQMYALVVDCRHLLQVRCPPCADCALMTLFHSYMCTYIFSCTTEHVPHECVWHWGYGCWWQC